MAKKKKNPEGQSPEPKPPGEPKPKAKRAGRPPSRGSKDLEAKTDEILKKMLGGPKRVPADTIRLKVEKLLHEAFEAEDPADVVALAKKAIEVWPDCADAYVLLAEQSRGPKEALDLYSAGVAAAERDLGEATFQRSVGDFWRLLNTRPYMRARHGLAQVLWVLGRRAEAVEHYLEMLRLNPNDNQGVRYNLAACLIEMGRDEDLGTLLSGYGEDASATWCYSAALLAFRVEGDSPRARKLLSVAKKGNKYVPDFLTGKAMLPSRMPETIGAGDRDEAIDYAVGFLNGWRTTPGALAWLRGSGERRKTVKTKPKLSKGPTAAVKKRLSWLPLRVDGSWQAETRRLPVWMNVGGELRRPWIVLIVSKTDDLILGQEVIEGPPSAELLWDKIAEAMSAPAMGEPHRPATVEIRASAAWDALAPHFEELEIHQEVSDRLDLVDDILEKLVEHVCGRAPGPGLLEMPGVNAAQVASFFQAAAVFYRAAPWQRVGGAETLKIACERFESGPWYAVVIGQMGMTLGVALYEDLGALERMRDGDASDEQNARETVALSVTYGDQTEIPVTDLDAAERLGWEVAGPEAYPAPIRKERGLVMRPPLSWELTLLEACLRAIPQFVLGHDRANTDPEVVEVPTGTGPLSLSLSWLAPDSPEYDE